jgi:hypothetical protein
LFHVSDGKSSEGRIFRENFNAHGFSGNHINQTGLTSLDEFWEFFNNFTSSSVNGRKDFFEFDGNVACVAVQDRAITTLDLTRVIEDNDLCCEIGNFRCWIIFSIRAYISSSDILNRYVFNVESNVVAWNGLIHRFVMHFNRFNISGNVHWGECNRHVGFKNTSFNSSDGDSSDTTDLVDIL